MTLRESRLMISQQPPRKYSTDLNLADALSTVVPPSRVTIREKITLITDSLRHQKSISFRSLVNHENSRLEIVVTFLAMLELIKRHLVRVSQDGLVW